MRTDDVHCRESVGTGPVNLKYIYIYIYIYYYSSFALPMYVQRLWSSRKVARSFYCPQRTSIDTLFLFYLLEKLFVLEAAAEIHPPGRLAIDVHRQEGHERRHLMGGSFGRGRANNAQGDSIRLSNSKAKRQKG